MQTAFDLSEAPVSAAKLALLAEKVMAWLTAAHACGAKVFIGDPGRTYFPKEGLEKLAQYQVPTTRELEDMEIKKTSVWTMPD